MTDLSGNGVSVTLPQGWEGRVFRRPAAGEAAPPPTSAGGADPRAQASTDPGEPPAPEGASTNTVVHVSTIPLPVGAGDFASGAVERLGDDDALVVVFEYDAASASQPLFAREGFPRALAPADFSPNVLQRSIKGQAGAQVFFHDAGRAFCLYVVLGSYQNRARIVPEVNRVLATFAIEGGGAPASSNTVVDVIAARPELATFSALLADSGLAELLAAEPSVTVFAPVSTSFEEARLMRMRGDPALAQRTLMHHVVRERLGPSDLRSRTTLLTAVGGTVTVTTPAGSIALDGIDVVPVPADATNGLVYVIRAVLEPPR